MSDKRDYNVRLASGRRARINMPYGIPDDELLRLARSVEAQRFGRPRRESLLRKTLLIVAWFALIYAVAWLATR